MLRVSNLSTHRPVRRVRPGASIAPRPAVPADLRARVQALPRTGGWAMTNARGAMHLVSRLA